MTKLLRAPRDCGSWMWFPERVASGLTAQYALAAKLTAITARHDLLRSPRVDSRWLVDGVIVPQAYCEVQAPGALDPSALAAAVVAARPAGLPERAEPGEIEISGPGTWLDADRAPHTEDELVRIEVELVTRHPWVSLEVFHDVWMACDFAGRPHPEVYQHNASRLAAAITDINTLLCIDAEPGEHTYFGRSVALGIENAVDSDHVPLDVADLILMRR